ncbi:MAG: hypothetical protein VW867_06110 [Gammaproteobacteria bacterium]
MSIRLNKEWQAAAVATSRLGGSQGVYQLADQAQRIIFIGYAGGKSQFGLKGEVADALQQTPAAEFVRWEVNTAYMSRYKELLMIHLHDYGQLPVANEPGPDEVTVNELSALGRLRPAG